MAYRYHIAEPALQPGDTQGSEASFGALGANEALLDKIPSAAFACKSLYNPTHDQTSIQVADVLAYLVGQEADWPQEAIFKIGFVRYNPTTQTSDVVPITYNGGQATSGVRSPGELVESDNVAQGFKHLVRNAKGGYDAAHHCCCLVTFPTANIAVASGGAAQSAQSVNLAAPLTRGIAAGAVIVFASGKTATLSANVLSGASALPVAALAAALDAGDTATYNKGLIPNTYKGFTNSYANVSEWSRLDATTYDPHNSNPATVLAMPSGTTISSGGYRPRVIAGDCATLVRESWFVVGDSVGEGTGDITASPFLPDVSFINKAARLKNAAATNACQNSRNFGHLMTSIDQTGGSRFLKLAKYFHWVVCQLAHNSVAAGMPIGASVNEAGSLKQAYHKLCQAVAAVAPKTKVAGMTCGSRATNTSTPSYSTITGQTVQNQATQKAWRDWMLGTGVSDIQSAGNANFAGFVDIYGTAVEVGPPGNKKTRTLGVSPGNTSSADFGKHNTPLFADPNDAVMSFTAANGGTRQDLRIEGLNIVDWADLVGFTIVWDSDTTTVALRGTAASVVGVITNIADATGGGGNVRLGGNTTFVAGDKGKIYGRYITDGAGIHPGPPGVAVMSRSVAASPVLTAFDASDSAPPANTTAADMRAAILSAYNSGAKEYVIPAGTYLFEAPIYLTEQYKDFTIRGAGSVLIRGDKKLATSTLSYAFVVGPQITLHNLFGLTNQSNVSVGDLAEGAAFFTPPTADLSKFAVGDLIAVWDPSFILHTNNVSKNCNHVELCRVGSISSGNVYFDVALGRSFTGASVAIVKNLAGSNLRFSNLEFDGSVDGSTDRNDGLVKVDLCDGLTLDNLTVKHFNTRAVVEQFCRKVRASNIRIEDGADPASPGNGYGLSFVGGRDLKGYDSYTTGCRHGFIFHNGAMDAALDDCDAEGENGNIDTHGCDERRISINNCRATGSINIGSGAWRGGGKSFTISNSHFGGAFHNAPNTEGIVFNYGTLAGISSDGGTSTVDFRNILFTGLPAFGLNTDGAAFGTYLYTDCRYTLASGLQGVLLDSRNFPGKHFFVSGNVATVVQTGAYVPIFLSGGGASVEFGPAGLTIVNLGTNPRAFALQTVAGYAGTVSDRGGLTYTTPNFQKLYQDDANRVFNDVDFPPLTSVIQGSTSRGKAGVYKPTSTTVVKQGETFGANASLTGAFAGDGSGDYPPTTAVLVGFTSNNLPGRYVATNASDVLVGKSFGPDASIPGAYAPIVPDYPDRNNVLAGDTVGGLAGLYVGPPATSVQIGTSYGPSGLIQGLLDPIGGVYELEPIQATQGNLPNIEIGATYAGEIPGLPNLSGADAVWITAKKSKNVVLDSHSEFQVVRGEGLRWIAFSSDRASQGSLDVPQGNTLVVRLSASATASLKAKDLYFDVRIRTGNVVQKIHSGKVKVAATVGRSVV